MLEITSAEQYQALREKIRIHDEEVRSITGDKGGSYDPAKLVQPIASNEEKSAVECYEFQFNPPAKAFVYIGKEYVTTWTGQRLGLIVGRGREYRDNFGGTRQTIRFRGINGFFYSGTYFVSSGSYARVKLCLSCRGWRLDRFDTGWNDTQHGLDKYWPSYIRTWETEARTMLDKNPANSYASGILACLACYRAMGTSTPRR